MGHWRCAFPSRQGHIAGVPTTVCCPVSSGTVVCQVINGCETRQTKPAWTSLPESGAVCALYVPGHSVTSLPVLLGHREGELDPRQGSWHRGWQTAHRGCLEFLFGLKQTVVPENMTHPGLPFLQGAGGPGGVGWVGGGRKRGPLFFGEDPMSEAACPPRSILFLWRITPFFAFPLFGWTVEGQWTEGVSSSQICDSWDATCWTALLEVVSVRAA